MMKRVNFMKEPYHDNEPRSDGQVARMATIYKERSDNEYHHKDQEIEH